MSDGEAAVRFHMAVARVFRFRTHVVVIHVSNRHELGNRDEAVKLMKSLIRAGIHSVPTVDEPYAKVVIAQANLSDARLIRRQTNSSTKVDRVFAF